MILRPLLSIVLSIGFLNAASAADYVNFDQIYPKPEIVTSAPGPTQVDYANSYVSLGQFAVLPNGAGTLVTGGSVNSNAFIAGSPVMTSLQQRLDGALSQIQQTQQGLASALSQIQQTQRGLAATAAMANIWMPSAPGKTAWAVNGATFMGEMGAGFSVAHRLNFSVPIAITASYGNGGSNVHVGRIGLMGEF